jgi:hypothetical protein
MFRKRKTKRHNRIPRIDSSISYTK